MHKIFLLGIKSYMETAQLFFPIALFAEHLDFLGFFRFEPYTEGRHLIRILGYIFSSLTSSPWSIRPLTALQRSTSNDENKFQM